MCYVRENPNDGPRNDFLNQGVISRILAPGTVWERVMSGDSMVVIGDNCLIHLLNTIMQFYFTIGQVPDRKTQKMFK